MAPAFYPSPARIRWACARKVRFNSWREADKVAGAMRRRDDDETVHAYFCRFCGGFHVGHQRGGSR